MKKIINSCFTNLLSFYYKIRLPKYYGDYFVTPQPKYLSQFVSILPSSIKVTDPLTNKNDIKKYGAKNSEEFTFWTWRNCGIACVKMILDAKKLGQKSNIMQLTREGIKLGGYITYLDGKFVDKGWFHHSLKALLNKYDLKSSIKKWQSIESVAVDILSNAFVIISVTVPGRSHIINDGSFRAKKNAKYGGHLLLATGVKMNGKKIEGIYVHDPRGLESYQSHTWIPTQTFKRIFSNRTITTH